MKVRLSMSTFTCALDATPSSPSPDSHLLLPVRVDSLGLAFAGPLLDNPNWMPYTQCIDPPRGEVLGFTNVSIRL